MAESMFSSMNLTGNPDEVVAEFTKRVTAGTLTTGLTTFGIDRVREVLRLPVTIVPMSAIYLGVPAKKLSAPRRRPAMSVTFRDRFGNSW